MSPQKKKLEAAIDSLFSTPKLHPKKENHTTVSASAHAEPTSVPVSGDAVALVPPPPAVVDEPAVEPVEVKTVAAETVATEPVVTEPVAVSPVKAVSSLAPEPIQAAAPAPVVPAPAVTAASAPAASAAAAPAVTTASASAAPAVTTASASAAPAVTTASASAAPAVTAASASAASAAAAPAAAAPAAPAAAKNAAVSLGLGATIEQQEDCRGDFQSVVFTLDNQYYGLSISAVESIIKLQAITELPHARHSIIGVTNLRGKVMPVIDLRQRFGLGSKEATKNSRIIVVNFDQIEAGLLVDGVSEVLTVDKCDIEDAPAMISMGNISACFIKGIAKVDDRLVILLDLKEVLYLEK
jgi:purine-binding chemotaxis protein CheW